MDKEHLHGCNCGEEESCGCGCDCGCGDHEHETLIVDLEDENGNIVPCEVIDGFEYKDSEYVLVQNPQDEAVYLFKVVGEGDDAELVIPEDAEFDEVTQYYETLVGENE